VLILGSARRRLSDNHFCFHDDGVINPFPIGFNCGSNYFCETLAAKFDKQPRRDNAESYDPF